MERNYINQEVIDILEEGHLISVYNGVPKIGNTTHYDIFCIREKDLKNVMRSYKKLGYFTYANHANYLIVKKSFEELVEFARTPEMLERFKNWKEFDYPPELVRLFIMQFASYTPRTIVCEELLKELKNKN